jgi:hypothetical protein
MENLEIPRKKEIPSVLLNAETGEGSIEGECYDSGIILLFERINHWLMDYAALGKPFSLLINVQYYNTSASKCFPDLFEIIEKINANADEQWSVKIIASDDEDEKQEWSEMLPEFSTAKFQIQ